MPFSSVFHFSHHHLRIIPWLYLILCHMLVSDRIKLNIRMV
jgi:hypothetical protein